MNRTIIQKNKQNNDDNPYYSRLIRSTCRRFLALLHEDKTTLYVPDARTGRGKLPDGCVHLCHELFLEITGSCIFRFPGTEKILRPDEILLVPPGVPHREKALPAGAVRFRNLLLMFSPDCATVHIAETTARNPSLPKPYFMEKLPVPSAAFYYHAAEMLAAIDRTRPDGHTARRAIVAAILHNVLNDLGAPTDRNVWANQLDVPCGDPYKIELVKKHIAENLISGDLAVDRLARLAEYSPNYLSHRFRQTTGETLKQFINRKKMEAARALLESTPYNIAEIALHFGYQDPSYFSKLFRRQFGVHPHLDRPGGRSKPTPKSPPTP